MEIVDAKVRSWYSDRPSRPWAADFRRYYRDDPGQLLHAGGTNSPEMVLTELDEAGVRAAVLTPAMVYGRSMELEFDAISHHPDRFALFGVVDHRAPDLDIVLERARGRGLRGLHVPGLREAELVGRREFDSLLEVCAELGLVVMFPLPSPVVPPLLDVLRRYRAVHFYVDGTPGKSLPLISGVSLSDAFRDLGTLLLMAQLPNVGVMLTGLPAFSFEPFPFRDIWSPITQIVEAYGAERVSWASDYTRTAGLYSYVDGMRYLGEIPSFSEEQRALIYGESLVERIGWSVSGDD